MERKGEEALALENKQTAKLGSYRLFQRIASSTKVLCAAAAASTD